MALALMFLVAGGSKLAGVPAMVTLFDALGAGQWFRYVTGIIEVVSGLALLTPAVAVFGALLLIPDDDRRDRRELVCCPSFSGCPSCPLVPGGGRRLGPSRSASNLLRIVR